MKIIIIIVSDGDEGDADNLISKEHSGRHTRKDHDKEWKKLWVVKLDFLLCLLDLPIILNMSIQ